VNIGRDDLAAAAATAPELLTRNDRSHAAFIQFLPAGALPDEGAVVNIIAPGYGKTISRFLYGFPESVLTLQRETNAAAEGESILAEVCDNSAHNTNLHPPLLRYEIASPGAQTAFRPEQQLPVRELLVGVHQDSLALFHAPTGNRVEVLDLGFQGLGGRSQLFRLMMHAFSRATYTNLTPITRAASAVANVITQHPSGAAITMQPRVVYEDRLVLRRRSWLFPAETLPLRASGESDRVFWYRVDDWRGAYAIPMHVFIYVTRNRNVPPRAGRKAATVSRDDYKPQFISFANWFSVSLFEKLIGKVSGVLTVEEMLPGMAEMVERNGKHYPTEVILQWNSGLR
jgi:hypothetical protein